MMWELEKVVGNASQDRRFLAMNSLLQPAPGTSSPAEAPFLELFEEFDVAPNAVLDFEDDVFAYETDDDTGFEEIVVKEEEVDFDLGDTFDNSPGDDTGSEEAIVTMKEEDVDFDLEGDLEDPSQEIKSEVEDQLWENDRRCAA